MIALVLASSALHAQERRPTRGERLALEGRCEVAVPELEKELDLAPAPESARLGWRLGQCALRAKDYARAVTALERALAIDPTLVEAQLDLARARYHARDLDGADAALRASGNLSGEALWQLYRGMVDLARGDAQAAVVALQRAVDLNAATFQTRADPESIEPAASYYLAVALRAAGEEESARERLHGVADEWAGTDWANQAHRALGRKGRRVWLNLGTGLFYHSNVVLAGRDFPVADEITESDDVIGGLTADTGLDLGQWGNNSAGLLGGYRGRIHSDRDDLRQFDSHVPSASLWLRRELRADTSVRFRYDFAYMWVDTDPFRISNGGRLSLVHAWSPRSTTELFARSFVDDYRNSFEDVPDGPGVVGAPCPTPLPPPYDYCGPRFVNERRWRDLDGYGSGGGIVHSLPLPLGSGPIADPSLTAGYGYTYFESDGRELTHDAHRVFVGLGFALPRSIGLDLEASYTHHARRHPTLFPERDDVLLASSGTPRQVFLSNSPPRDQRYTFDSRLSIPLAEPFSLSFHYSYRLNESTSDVLDYDAHYVGFLIHVHLARAL